MMKIRNEAVLYQITLVKKDITWKIGYNEGDKTNRKPVNKSENQTLVNPFVDKPQTVKCSADHRRFKRNKNLYCDVIESSNVERSEANNDMNASKRSMNSNSLKDGTAEQCVPINLTALEESLENTQQECNKGDAIMCLSDPVGYSERRVHTNDSLLRINDDNMMYKSLLFKQHQKSTQDAFEFCLQKCFENFKNILDNDRVNDGRESTDRRNKCERCTNSCIKCELYDIIRDLQNRDRCCCHRSNFLEMHQNYEECNCHSCTQLRASAIKDMSQEKNDLRKEEAKAGGCIDDSFKTNDGISVVDDQTVSKSISSNVNSGNVDTMSRNKYITRSLITNREVYKYDEMMRADKMEIRKQRQEQAFAAWKKAIADNKAEKAKKLGRYYYDENENQRDSTSTDECSEEYETRGNDDKPTKHESSNVCNAQTHMKPIKSCKKVNLVMDNEALRAKGYEVQQLKKDEVSHRKIRQRYSARHNDREKEQFHATIKSDFDEIPASVAKRKEFVNIKTRQPQDLDTRSDGNKIKQVDVKSEYAEDTEGCKQAFLSSEKSQLASLKSKSPTQSGSTTMLSNDFSEVARRNPGAFFISIQEDLPAGVAARKHFLRQQRSAINDDNVKSNVEQQIEISHAPGQSPVMDDKICPEDSK